MEVLGPFSWARGAGNAIIFKRARRAQAAGQEMNCEAQSRAMEQVDSSRGTSAPSAPVQYVDALMSRANRQADVFSILTSLVCDGLAHSVHALKERNAAGEHFEVARQANEASDYQTAACHFEKAYLLHPKLDTLLSAANMHLKVGNQGIAHEIYLRVLRDQNASAAAREVAQRKLGQLGTGMRAHFSEADLAPGWVGWSGFLKSLSHAA